MKKLVLLLMLFGALRSFGAVATNVQNLSQFGTTNRAMPGDGIGLSTRYGTAGERLYGLRITNLVSTINALGAGTNTVLLSAGTNVIISTNRTGSNVTYTISVSTNDLGGASSMTNALLYAGPTNGSVGALILTAGDNIILSTSGTNRVITTSNNVSLIDVTNIISTVTNDILATVTNIANVASTNNVKVTAGTNIVVVTNVSGSVVTYNINSTSSSLGGALTPGVLDVASAPVIVIDLALTNTPVVVLTNAPAHVITLVVSNPAPGRWFSFYADGNGGITNNAIGWGGVDGLLLKWLDASTNSIIVSNGFVSVAGYIAQTASRTNLVITHRHE